MVVGVLIFGKCISIATTTFAVLIARKRKPQMHIRPQMDG